MNKEKISAIVAVLLPIILIAIVALVVYLPQTAINPEHDFVYTSRVKYYNEYKNDVFVENGRLISSPIDTNDNYRTPTKEYPEIFIYDVSDDSIKKVSFEEAKSLMLDPGPTSEDGYYVSYSTGGHDGIFELFGSNNSDRGYFISKGDAKRKLNLLGTSNNYYYSNDFEFIGWIK